MIVLNLLCQQGHGFEGWFGSADQFSQQHAARQVCCPVCGTSSIERRPSAPSIVSSAKSAPAEANSHPAQATQLAQLRQRVRGAEDVGQRFPEEARRMHYGETPARDIRGTASGRQLQSLLEEGVAVCPVPAALAEDLH